MSRISRLVLSDDPLSAALGDLLSPAETGSSKPTPTTPPDGGDLSAKPKPAADERQSFLDAFGPRGSVWFGEGMTFDQAAALYRRLVPNPRY
jgi:hypothetical protein